MKVAEDLNEIERQFVTTVTNSTTLICTGETETVDNTYKYGLAEIEGKGIVVCSGYTASSDTFTFSTGFSPIPVAGDVLKLAFWLPQKRGLALSAVKQAIRDYAYPYWYLEVKQDFNNLKDSSGNTVAAITLATGTNEYTLATEVLELLAVGIDSSKAGTTEPNWFGPLRGNWYVRGEPGALKLVFPDGYQGAGGSFADAYNGYQLCLHYVAAEPAITDETSTTSLPLLFFAVAADIYREMELNQASRTDLITANVNVPRRDLRAQMARSYLRGLKPPLDELRRPRTTLGGGR